MLPHAELGFDAGGSDEMGFNGLQGTVIAQQRDAERWIKYHMPHNQGFLDKGINLEFFVYTCKLV